MSENVNCVFVAYYCSVRVTTVFHFPFRCYPFTNVMYRRWYISIIKDPNAPQTPKSAIYYWYLDILQTIKAEDVFPDYKKDLLPDISNTGRIADLLYTRENQLDMTQEDKGIKARLSSFLHKPWIHCKDRDKYEVLAKNDMQRYTEELNNYRSSIPRITQDIDFQDTIDFYATEKVELEKSPDDVSGKSRLPPKDGWSRQEYYQGYLSLSEEDLKDMSSYRACLIGPRVYLTPADFPTVEEFEDAAYSAAYKLYYNETSDHWTGEDRWYHKGTLDVTPEEINNALSTWCPKSVLRSTEPTHVTVVSQLHQIVQSTMRELKPKHCVNRPIYKRKATKSSKTSEKKNGRPKLSPEVIADRVASGMYRELPGGQLKKVCSVKDCKKLAVKDGVCLKHKST